MQNKLAIISVVYQNYLLLDDFFNSLKNQKNKNFHVFICDNSPNKQPIDTKGVSTAIISAPNLGYAYGINRGLKKALEEGFLDFCVINNDTFFQPDFVGNALLSIAGHSGALVGGKIYYASGYEYHKERYKKDELGKVLWFAGGFVDWNHAITKHRGVDEIDKGQYDKVEETDFLTGCLILFDKYVIDKVGLFNEKYFLYYEDADYCERAKRSEIKIFYDPSIAIWHKVSQSTGGSGSSIHKKYQERNRVVFGLKYAPLKTKFHLVKNYLLSRLSLRA